MTHSERGIPIYSADEATDLMLSSDRWGFCVAWDKHVNNIDQELAVKTRWYIHTLERVVAAHYRTGAFRTKEGLPEWRALYAQRKFSRP